MIESQINIGTAMVRPDDSVRRGSDRSKWPAPPEGYRYVTVGAADIERMIRNLVPVGEYDVWPHHVANRTAACRYTTLLRDDLCEGDVLPGSRTWLSAEQWLDEVGDDRKAIAGIHAMPNAGYAKRSYALSEATGVAVPSFGAACEFGAWLSAVEAVIAERHDLRAPHRADYDAGWRGYPAWRVAKYGRIYVDDVDRHEWFPVKFQQPGEPDVAWGYAYDRARRAGLIAGRES